MPKFRLVAGLMATLLIGCSGDGDPNASRDAIAKLALEIKDLNAKVADLEGKLLEVRTRQITMFMDQLTAPQSSVLFDPQEEKKYLSLKSPAGTMLAMLEKVEPYLDGFTVSMKIGNPTSASFVGLKGKVKWGRAYDSSKDSAYNNALSEKEFELLDVMPAGRWTIVQFNIAPATPEQVRRIVFEPTFNSLRLSGL